MENNTGMLLKAIATWMQQHARDCLQELLRHFLKTEILFQDCGGIEAKTV